MSYAGGARRAAGCDPLAERQEDPADAEAADSGLDLVPEGGTELVHLAVVERAGVARAGGERRHRYGAGEGHPVGAEPGAFDAGSGAELSPRRIP